VVAGRDGSGHECERLPLGRFIDPQDFGTGQAAAVVAFASVQFLDVGIETVNCSPMRGSAPSEETK